MRSSLTPRVSAASAVESPATPTQQQQLGTFAHYPKRTQIKVLPTATHAVRHERYTADVNMEVIAKTMRTLLDKGGLGVSRCTAEKVIVAAFVASYGSQHGGDVKASDVNALRKVLAHATEKNDDGDYVCQPGSVGTKKHAPGAKAALEASFCWRNVFSAAKLQSADSRSVTSDGCGLHLTLLAKSDSGGRAARVTSARASNEEKEEKKRKDAEKKKQMEEEEEAKARTAVPGVTRAEDAPIVLGGDFGRGGGFCQSVRVGARLCGHDSHAVQGWRRTRRHALFRI